MALTHNTLPPALLLIAELRGQGAAVAEAVARMRAVAAEVAEAIARCRADCAGWRERVQALFDPSFEMMQPDLDLWWIDRLLPADPPEQPARSVGGRPSRREEIRAAFELLSEKHRQLRGEPLRRAIRRQLHPKLNDDSTTPSGLGRDAIDRALRDLMMR
jgi:hypothetical protein